MNVLIPPPGRQLRRRAFTSLEDAVLAAVPPAIVYFTRHPTFIPGWLQIGLPFVIGAPLRFWVLTVLWPSPAPQVSWDREGLRCKWPEDESYIPWSDYAGHRFTWDLPRRLKIRRKSRQPSVTIDLAAFDDHQRDALMAEIAARTAALPNKRLKLSARVD